ncbi:MAG: DUF192 domain-containing protein [Paracoccaceae bacterium]
MGFGFKIVRLLVILVAGLSAFVPTLAHAAVCDPSVISLRGDWGQAKFSIEIADDSAERAQGLMHRDQMPRTAGMLFIYEAPQTVAFWMKNTLIPLDMIFVDKTGLVTAIHENAVPLDETAIPGGSDVLYVLEINAGMVSVLGIGAGSQISHPRIDQNIALWTCEAQ